MFMQPVNVHYASEWLQPRFQSGWGLAFLLLVFFCFVAQVVSPIIYQLEIAAPLMVFSFETFLQSRLALVFFCIFTPILAVILAKWLPIYDVSKERYGMNAVFVLFLICCSIALLPSNAKLQALQRKRYPVDAIAYLKAHPKATGMLNDDYWGGFLLWSLPEQKVFIDGRLDIYEYGGILPDYISIRNAEQNAPQLLKKYGIRACLLYQDQPLVHMLAASPEWEKEYEDRISIIFRLKTPTEEHPPEKKIAVKIATRRTG
jgi:hypothetical protein